MVDLQPEGEQTQFIFVVELGEVRGGVGQADAQLNVALHPPQGIFQRIFGGIDRTQHGVGQGASGFQAAYRVIEQ
ncbi:hypothetical protein D3C86_2003650 [compost metagenome]